MKPLLTIAIPTYNRSLYLRRNLDFLYNQINDFENKVEIIVSDNASIDDTYVVVNDFLLKGLPITYIKNIDNKGPDFNISQCYITANGKYVLTLGDDDLLVNGSIKAILNLVTEDYGVIFLNSAEFIDQKEIKKGKLNYINYDEPIEFIKKINFYVTFISGNIINKKYLDEQELIKHNGSYLIQVSFILNAILNAPQNLYIDDIMLFVEPDNTGGYNLFKIFGENFYSIVNNLKSINKNEIVIVRNIIFNNLLVNFFPQYILKFKLTNNHSFIKTNPILNLKSIFSGYINFWLCCYVLNIMPNKLAKIYSYLIKFYSKIRAVFIGY